MNHTNQVREFIAFEEGFIGKVVREIANGHIFQIRKFDRINKIDRIINPVNPVNPVK